MPTAELIAIGTELLLGDFVDTNSQYLAQSLRGYGIDLFRITIVGDNSKRIVDLIRESIQRADIVITTGGLGPTIDDPTREAAAIAMNTTNEFHPELWEKILQRFNKRGIQISENNKKQAFIPHGALIVENPVGTAPSFILTDHDKFLICLPGVPAEMKIIMQTSINPWLITQFNLVGTIKSKVLHTSGMTESKVDEIICDLEQFNNPTIGLLAHPGIVDIRITAKADSIPLADKMIDNIELQIRNRLGKTIFGEDGETLPSSILKLVESRQDPIHIFVSGFLSSDFLELSHPLISIEDSNQMDPGLIKEQENQPKTLRGPITFRCKFDQNSDFSSLTIDFFGRDHQDHFSQQYFGAPLLRGEWAINILLSFVHRKMESSGNFQGDL
ncbi:MAG: CinA family nicotinamide mononucleotide deamidase-related protein [Chloroflexi bacterium]|nr:CinA family nicotinamide mononucleotide deamidase-related protein [Chloroflexota bacterium]